MMRDVPLEWSVGHAADERATPARRVPAQVPGAVQLDWARAQGWPPYWQGENAANYRWMEDVFWTYRTQVPPVALAAEERLFFVCGGVDYRCVVRVDGVDVHAQEGMFTAIELELTAHAARGAIIEVVVFPAPTAPSPQPDRHEARACVKPAVSYGWDFHPRLIPLGIWERTRVEIRSAAHLRDAEVRYRLNGDWSAADLSLAVLASEPAIGQRVLWVLSDPADHVVWTDEFTLESPHAIRTASLPYPQLWWPRGHGPQPLYTSRVKLVNSASDLVQRVGFRRVRLVLADELRSEPPTFPKTRRPAPTTFEINGRRLFAKGSNWVPPEIFPGIVTAETYRPLLQLACEANLNLLRVWGGGPVPKESFFDLCDEAGLLVWQDFPLACNPYPDDPAYLRVLDQESRSIIRRVRRHACLALWSGGNELFNSWSGMDDQALPLRLLNRNCYELDPATPFIPTSPIEGTAHGDYRFRDEHGREVFALFTNATYSAYPEFGLPGPAPVTALHAFLPADELWPPRPGGAWSFHHGFDAWELEPTGWLALATQRHYFGEPPDLETLVARGDWLQCEGLKCLFEEARRQQPRCGMALNWCFNEPWPAAANNSLVHWPTHAKPALAAVAAACRPRLASARISKFSWRPGEQFRTELWLLDDAFEAQTACVIAAALQLGDHRILLGRWEAPAGSVNRRGPVVVGTLPSAPGVDEMLLELRVSGQPEFDSRYRLHFHHPTNPPDRMTDAQRLTRLEENLTHLQRHVTEQDKVMLALADEVARLKQELGRLRAQTTVSPDSEPAPADERPPHY